MLIGMLANDGQETAETGTMSETWYYDAEAYVAAGKRFPTGHRVGDPYPTNTMYILKSIKVNPNNKRGYWGENNPYNGKLTGIATFEWEANYRLTPDVFSLKIAGSGYETFKINTGAMWGRIEKPCGIDDMVYDLKLPVSQLDLTTVVYGELNELFYDSYRNKLNSVIFKGRAEGCVLFETYSVIPKYNNGAVIETELTLTFKMLPQDWNWEFRNAKQYLNTFDGKPAFWQDQYPGRFDFAGNPTFPSNIGAPNIATFRGVAITPKPGLPIWVGTKITVATDLKYYDCGDDAYGVSGWDYKLYGVAGDYTKIRGYANLNELLVGAVLPPPTGG